MPSGSRLLDDAGLELHGAETLHLAIDVVVADTVDEVDIANFGADLDRARTALDFEVLDDGDGVAVGEDISKSILYDWLGRHFHFGSGRPLVRTFGTHQ